MAVIKTIHYPNGTVVRIMDDDFDPDQEAAWKHAREVHARIHWEIELKKLAASRRGEAEPAK